MKFLYLIKRPLTPRDRDRYGINFMLDHGHSVTVLDLSEVIHPCLDHGYAGVFDDDRVDIREIASWPQFEGQRQAFLDSDLVILQIQSYGLSRSTYHPLRMIAKTGVPYLILAPTLYPGWDIKTKKPSFIGIIADKRARLRKMDPVNSLISRLPPSWLGIGMAAYIVYPSLAGEGSNTLVGPLTKAIKAHTFDYEIYLDELKQGPDPLDRAVFLDQFMPYHPDAKATGITHVDDKKYFHGLCQVFDRIENELGLEVVIAAHPRADYEARPGLFGDRQVISGKTAHLVATSRLVLAHQSTAIGFAVLFKKPIMFLVNRSIYNVDVYGTHCYEAFASELGSPLLFFDSPASMELSNVCTVNNKLYDDYIGAYLKHPDSNAKPLWGNILDKISADLS